MVDSWNWRLKSACLSTDTKVFFDPERTGEAKSICAGCPVIEQCRQFATSAKVTHGVYGGQTPEERGVILPPDTEFDAPEMRKELPPITKTEAERLSRAAGKALYRLRIRRGETLQMIADGTRISRNKTRQFLRNHGLPVPVLLRGERGYAVVDEALIGKGKPRAERTELLRQLASKGAYGSPELADLTGLSVPYVRRVAVESGIEIPNRLYDKGNANRYAAMVKMLDAGSSPSDVAALFRVSESTVFRARRLAGGSARKGPSPDVRQQRIARAVELHGSGMSVPEISAETGWHVRTIKEYLAAHEGKAA